MKNFKQIVLYVCKKEGENFRCFFLISIGYFYVFIHVSGIIFIKYQGFS